jgi:hypothetical protein
MLAHNFIKQTLLDIKAQTNPNIIIVCDLNFPLSPIDTSRQKINKGTPGLNGSLDQKDLTNIYKISHLTAAEYTLFSVVMEHSPKQIS